MVKVKFVARLGKMGEEKIHVLVPKEHWDTLKHLVRKQVHGICHSFKVIWLR
jgi:hypothetical protein